jgi:hypothetical protein
MKEEARGNATIQLNYNVKAIWKLHITAKPQKAE